MNDNTPRHHDSPFDLRHEVLCTVVDMADDTDEAIRAILYSRRMK